jgi:hypothetical protein
MRDLPAASEPVLVDVDVEVDRFAESELSELRARLRGGAPRSDLLVWYGSARPDPFEALGAAGE